MTVDLDSALAVAEATETDPSQQDFNFGNRNLTAHHADQRKRVWHVSRPVQLRGFPPMRLKVKICPLKRCVLSVSLHPLTGD